jgi:2-polyprenyl-3-methyl-5-hydroxy-6-metoxy-1,4-benzoquinol methylase
MTRIEQQQYAIEGGVQGKARLSLLSRVMATTTIALFERVGVKPGMACLDMGCGGGDVTRLLAERVGVIGRVIGVDFDAEVIRLAERDAVADQLHHVAFHVADLFDYRPEAPFDLVYARFLLSHLRDPSGAIAHLRQMLKPSGVLVVEDIEISGCFCHPPSPVFNRAGELYRATILRKGTDPDIGPKLPELLMAAGLQDVGVNVAQPAFLAGEGKAMMSLTLKRISGAVLAERLMSAPELDALSAELVAFESRSDALIGLPRIFQAWGRL